MEKHIDKITVNRAVGNTLVALTHERNLPFDIQEGAKLDDGDLNLLITLEKDDIKLLNETLCEIINKML